MSHALSSPETQLGVLHFAHSGLLFTRLRAHCQTLKAQGVVDSKLLRQVRFAGDPVKLFLGLLSVIYDTIIIYQHYVLYSESKPRQQGSAGPERDAESLLPPREAEQSSAS